MDWITGLEHWTGLLDSNIKQAVHDSIRSEIRFYNYGILLMITRRSVYCNQCVVESRSLSVVKDGVEPVCEAGVLARGCGKENVRGWSH